MKLTKYRGTPYYNDEVGFVYGNLVEFVSMTGGENIHGHLTMDHGTKITAILDESGTVIRVKPETVGICTGIRDKNMEFMYEHDKVSRRYYVYSYDDSGRKHVHYDGRIIGEVVYLASKGFMLKPKKYINHFGEEEEHMPTGSPLPLNRKKCIVIGNYTREVLK